MTRASDKPPTAGAAVSFDTLAALLGGAPARGLVDDRTTAVALDRPQAWLSPGATSAHANRGLTRQFALEVLALKLHAFVAACRAVPNNRAQPLPANAFAATIQHRPTSVMPARWNFELQRNDGDQPTSHTSLTGSLGAMLARLLLTTDARTADQAEALALQASKQLASAAALPGGSTGAAFTSAYSQVMNGEAGDPGNVLFAADRRQNLAADFSITCWPDVISTALHWLAGLSKPSGITQALAVAEGLLERARVAAFGAAAQRSEVSALLRDNLARR